MSLWVFIQDQVLGMKWLNELIGELLLSVGVDIYSKMGGSIQFWLYDVIKIFVLLGILIYGISIIESYFPPEKCKKNFESVQRVESKYDCGIAWYCNPFL